MSKRTWWRRGGALCLAVLCFTACRVTKTTDVRGQDPMLQNRGAPAPYVRGTVRPDGTYVRPWANDGDPR